MLTATDKWEVIDPFDAGAQSLTLEGGRTYSYLDSHGVPRDYKDRPLIRQACDCDGGRIPGARGPRSRKCQKCSELGFVFKPYTRVSSYGSLLDDETQLQLWKQRILVTGYAIDPTLMADFQRIDQAGLHSLDEDVRKATKAAMNEVNERAFAVGDVQQLAQKGTDLHKLAEHRDRDEPIPSVLRGDNGVEREVTLQDRADLAAWVRAVEALELEILDVERFVVCDEIGAAGTLDRRGFVRVKPKKAAIWCDCELPKILDLKSGRVDYGAGKIGQQLAIYSRSVGYDPATGGRVEMPTCQRVGIIIHLPQGTGQAGVLTADLDAAWSVGVDLAGAVREYRNVSKRWLAPIVLDKESA